MEEQKKIERNLMSQEEFEDYLERYLEDNKVLVTFEAVSKFKSVNRAIRRGHVFSNGLIIPKRPFNNRANSNNRKYTHSRKLNELKKQIYGRIKY